MTPNSPQEAFDLTIDAFNLSERFRVPVLVMMDECVGHMTEKVVIPSAEQIDLVPRTLTDQPPGEFLPYRVNGNDVPEFAHAGDGYKFHTTGLTHDERGYPVMSAECQETCVRRLLEKITLNADKIVLTAGKAERKPVYRHSGYPGGLRQETYADKLARRPEQAVRDTIRGMIPKTRLGRAQINKLKVYAGPTHPHEAQKPQPYPIDRARSRV